MDNSRRTLYLCDLDGTLLGRNGRISEHSLGILNRMIENGLAFTYATARSVHSARIVTQGLTLRLPVIVYNGCMLLNPNSGERFFSLTFTGAQCDRIRALIRVGTGLLVYAWIDGAERVSWLFGQENEGLLHYLSSRKNDPRLRPVNTFDTLFDGQPFYFTFVGEQADLAPLYRQLVQDTAYTCTFQQELYRPEYWLEIMPRRATKAEAARTLKQMLGFSRMIAFGDAVNDLALFETADEAYAVANAADALKKRANAVIASNDADGVALWLAANSEIPT